MRSRLACRGGALACVNRGASASEHAEHDLGLSVLDAAVDDDVVEDGDHTREAHIGTERFFRPLYGGNLFRSAVAAGAAPRVHEDERQRRDFVHVDEIARANVASLRAIAVGDGPLPGQLRAYNVGTGSPHTVGELAAALASAHGGPAPIVTGDYRLGDVRHITASSDRISRELGWQARVAFADGMAEFAQGSSQPPATFEDRV